MHCAVCVVLLQSYLPFHSVFSTAVCQVNVAAMLYMYTCILHAELLLLPVCLCHKVLDVVSEYDKHICLILFNVHNFV